MLSTRAQKISTTPTTANTQNHSSPVQTAGSADLVGVRGRLAPVIPESTSRWSGTGDLPPTGRDVPANSASASHLPAANDDGPMRSSRAAGFPSILVSTIIHTLLLIVLALLTLPSPSGTQAFLSARLGEAAPDVSIQRIDLSTVLADQSQDDAAQDAVSIQLNQQPVTPPAPSAESSLDTGTTQATSEALLALAGGQAAPSQLVQIPSGGGLAGREPQQRKVLALSGGGSVASENAVDMALQYLANHQRSNGSWSFDLTLDPCGGRCRHSKKIGNDPTPPTAATGLALLAFLGAGHTHTGAGPYAENVRRGLYYLRGIAAQSQRGLDWQQGSMYGHGIALMAMGEAVTLTTSGKPEDHEFYSLLYDATSFTCNAQHHGGSWGYYPQSPGDTTLTGWQVLSLIAARRNNVPLHSRTLHRAKKFVLSTRPGQQYAFGYKGSPATPTTTAIGLTLMLYLGESPYDSVMIKALTAMANRGPTLTNIYHDYYATLALHHTKNTHYGDQLWEQWNRVVRDHLVATQEQSGHEKGSWHFSDRYGNVGGRIYTTAMCALTLETYYRYQPLYGPADSFRLD